MPKPTQVKFYRAAQMALFAQIAVFPPLGQVTVASPSRDPVSSSSPGGIHLILNIPLGPTVAIDPTMRGVAGFQFTPVFLYTFGS